ncbi:polyprenyl synthetase family protein [Patescibacteria group bacterium]
MNNANFVDTQKVLEDFRKKINIEIAKHLDKAISEAKKKDVLITDALRYVKKFTLAGGKRLRAALMYYGYLAVDGKDKQRMLETAVSIELIHVFLLIHDDIMDRDKKRHGVDTVSFKYQKLGKRISPTRDYEHFGNSIAIVIGDMIGAIGSQIIFDSGFDTKLVFKALSRLQEIVSMTVIGQSKDVYLEYRGKATEKDILTMYEYKTAKYTIEGPLHLGASLGGANEKILQNMSRYAIPIGVAFQIQDDILGIFGSERKMGKAIGSDIREGKQTILVAKALDLASKKQKEKMVRIFGKENLSGNDIKDFQEIIRETGSLDYARNLSLKLINDGKKGAEKMKMSKESKAFLVGIADYMIHREL